jgi:hypothetical protein
MDNEAATAGAKNIKLRKPIMKTVTMFKIWLYRNRGNQVATAVPYPMSM